MNNFSNFELHYAFSLANALFADHLRCNPNLSAEEKAAEFKTFVEAGLFEAKRFTTENAD